MTQNFIIKEGKKKSSPFAILLFFFLLLFFLSNPHTQSDVVLIVITSMMLIGIIPMLVDGILFFRWIISFVVFLDMDKQEIILNHTLFFRKKRISLKDIKEVDTLNGNIILSASTSLSKWQRIVSKTKNSVDYTIRFGTIETSERRELTKLLSEWKSNSKE